MVAIIRGSSAPPTHDSQEGDDLGTLRVRFSRLGNWYEINSWFEGRFLERVAPGAFRFGAPADIRTLFNHGMDPSIGQKSLGVPDSITERDGYVVADVPLFDTSYTRDLLPGLRAGAYGSSFMFDVQEESWDYEPDKTSANPDGLPERTLRSVNLYEQGPVTWPANPEADASMNGATPDGATRSGTDWFYRESEARGLTGPGYGSELRSMLLVHRSTAGKLPAWQRSKLLREFTLEGK